jgi:BASS family bile acid:Na+ symporter
VHNGTLAIAVAISVLDSVELAVPAAVYSVLMFPVAALFGWAISRTADRGVPADAPAGA